MAGHFEVWAALRNELLDDSGLVAMLGESDAVFIGRPNIKTTDKLPFLDMLPGRSEAIGNTAPGEYRADLQIDCYGLTPYAAESVINAIINTFSIPFIRQTPIQSTSWNLTELIHISTFYAGSGQLLNSRQTTHQVTSLWKTRIIKR